jgi:hypothetical protein
MNRNAAKGMNLREQGFRKCIIYNNDEISRKCTTFKEYGCGGCCNNPHHEAIKLAEKEKLILITCWYDRGRTLAHEMCPFFRTDLPTKEYERIGSCPAIDEMGYCLSVCNHRANEPALTKKAAPEGEGIWDEAYDEGYEQGKKDATAKSLNPAAPALKGEVRDCDTCVHDGDCFVVKEFMLKCRGFKKSSRI